MTALLAMFAVLLFVVLVILPPHPDPLTTVEDHSDVEA
jgi:hypothetical protein